MMHFFPDKLLIRNFWQLFHDAYSWVSKYKTYVQFRTRWICTRAWCGVVHFTPGRRRARRTSSWRSRSSVTSRDAYSAGFSCVAPSSSPSPPRTSSEAGRGGLDRFERKMVWKAIGLKGYWFHEQLKRVIIFKKNKAGLERPLTRRLLFFFVHERST